MKNLYIIVLVLLVLPVDIHASGRRPSEKPKSPLSVSIAPLSGSIAAGDIKGGELVDIVVKVLSFVEADRMDLEIKLSGGIELVSGELEWSGPVQKNGETSHTITIRAPERGGGVIKARALILFSKGARFSDQALFRLGPPEKLKQTPLPPVKKDGRGREILEYRLE